MSINVQPLVATLLPMSIVPTVNSVLENIGNNYTIFDQIKVLPRCSVTLLDIDLCFQVTMKDIFRRSCVSGQLSCSWLRRDKSTSLIRDALRMNCGRGKNRSANLICK